VKGTKKDLIKKVEVTGFYPGHGIQTFYMDERVYAKTQPKLRILRNSPKRPKIGNLAPIDVDLDDPDKNSPDVLAEISASTKRARMPKSVLFAKPAKMPEYTYPPFFGTGLIEALQRFDGDPKKLAEWLSEQTVIYYDFETTGGLDSPTPIQISAVKYRNGEVVGRKNIFMNPGAKLDFFYTSKIEQGDPNILRDTDGNPISDEFLADQPPIKEALQEFIDFIDEGSILVAHNQVFDFEILMDYAKKLNIELPEDGFISGLIDTLTLSRRAYPGERIPHYLEAAVIREGVKIDDEEVKKGQIPQR
jgi:DNA polymerase III epsilon subunit-like protein